MKSTFHNLLNVLSIIAAVLLVALIVLLITGFRPYILESSSMEPSITKGSLVFARSIPLDSLSEGDPIIYRTNGLLVLHRYLGDGKIQGDANSISQDVKLTESNLVGVYSFHLPGVGSAISGLVSHRWILAVLIGLCVIGACMKHPSDREKAESVT